MIVFADLTITTEKLMELFAPLDPKNVDKLGERYRLGLPQSEIDKIQRSYQSPTQRKEAYLDLYVHQHPCPSWRDVARILRYKFELPQQADLVVNTYVKGTQDTLKLDSCPYVNNHVYNRKPCTNYIISKTHPPVYMHDL